ncbi:Ark- serine/threonine protein kinase [Tilletia horrida]|nr:Ark- serine/threonine protein kinase [Tilletia horrida]
MSTAGALGSPPMAVPARTMAAVSAPHTQPALGSGPLGTLAPGTLVRVGAYTCTIKRYLSQGGFAHVYLVSVPSPIPMPSPAKPTTLLVLKRMAVPDKEALVIVRNEVETHKQLRSHPYIAHFLEASASTIPSPAGSPAGAPVGGYEIFILMEYCPGGGLIDLMNARLRNRLRESEILHIFSQVCEGVAHMHHQNPPILHRDLKVENILLVPPPTANGPPSTLASCANHAESISFKLCDFGSAVSIKSRSPPANMDAARALEADLNRHTTLQYRAPEMVDVYRRPPIAIGEPADVWALGVLLYKLCYYTTPFEENGGGPLAILNVRYRFPPQPSYSESLKAIIKSILVERPESRPTIDQLRVSIARLRNVAPPSEALKRLAAEQTKSIQADLHDDLQSAASRFPPLEQIGTGKASIASSSSSSASTVPSPASPALPPLPSRAAARQAAIADDLISFRDDVPSSGSGRNHVDGQVASAKAELDRELRELEAHMDGKATMRRGRPVKTTVASSMGSALVSPVPLPAKGELEKGPRDFATSMDSKATIRRDWPPKPSMASGPGPELASPKPLPAKAELRDLTAHMDGKATVRRDWPPKNSGISGPGPDPVSPGPLPAKAELDKELRDLAVHMDSKATVRRDWPAKNSVPSVSGPESASPGAKAELDKELRDLAVHMDSKATVRRDWPAKSSVPSVSGPESASPGAKAELDKELRDLAAHMDSKATVRRDWPVRASTLSGSGDEPVSPGPLPAKAELDKELRDLAAHMDGKAAVRRDWPAKASVISSPGPGLASPVPLPAKAVREKELRELEAHADTRAAMRRGRPANIAVASVPADGLASPVPLLSPSPLPSLPARPTVRAATVTDDLISFRDDLPPSSPAAESKSNLGPTSVASPADSSPAEEPFRGVSDLIARWQAHAENPTASGIMRPPGPKAGTGAGGIAASGNGSPANTEQPTRRGRLPGRDI